MIRREFLAASAAGFFFPESASKTLQNSSPVIVPDPVIRERVASERGPYGFDLEKLKPGKHINLPKSEIRRIAWTVDDGASVLGVRDYLDFMEQYELRMTFFINSVYPAWKKNRKQIQALVDTGQLQIANHTHSHPSMTRLSNNAIKSELRKCQNFVEDTFGVSAKPYFRPPYGRIDSRVIRVAKEIGYLSPMMWSGSLGDSAAQRKRSILQMGSKWIQDRTILLDHFNDRTPKYVFKQLAKLLKKRELMTVTLNDVYYS